MTVATYFGESPITGLRAEMTLSFGPDFKPNGTMCPHYAEQIGLDNSRNIRK